MMLRRKMNRLMEKGRGNLSESHDFFVFMELRDEGRKEGGNRYGYDICIARVCMSARRRIQ